MKENRNRGKQIAPIESFNSQFQEDFQLKKFLSWSLAVLNLQICSEYILMWPFERLRDLNCVIYWNAAMFKPVSSLIEIQFIKWK